MSDVLKLRDSWIMYWYFTRCLSDFPGGPITALYKKYMGIYADEYESAYNALKSLPNGPFIIHSTISAVVESEIDARRKAADIKSWESELLKRGRDKYPAAASKPQARGRSVRRDGVRQARQTPKGSR